MITCTLRYTIDPYKLEEFERYGRMWITLVNRMGGTHHGYFLPYEGPNDVAYALFSCLPQAYRWAGFSYVDSLLLVAAAINVHHFVVDAFIWRLRAGSDNRRIVEAGAPA